MNLILFFGNAIIRGNIHQGCYYNCGTCKFVTDPDPQNKFWRIKMYMQIILRRNITHHTHHTQSLQFSDMTNQRKHFVRTESLYFDTKEYISFHPHQMFKNVMILGFDEVANRWYTYFDP